MKFILIMFDFQGFYLKDTYGLDPKKEGALFVSSFYLFFTFSRLFGGFLVEKKGYYQSMVFCIILTVIIYLIGFLLYLQGIWILVFTGLSIAQFWIILLSIAEKKFNKEAPIITSVIITISGFINGLFQIILGLTNEYIGNSWAYRSCLIYASILLCLVLIFKRQIITPINWDLK